VRIIIIESFSRFLFLLLVDWSDSIVSVKRFSIGIKAFNSFLYAFLSIFRSIRRDFSCFNEVGLFMKTPVCLTPYSLCDRFIVWGNVIGVRNVCYIYITFSGYSFDVFMLIFLIEQQIVYFVDGVLLIVGQHMEYWFKKSIFRSQIINKSNFLMFQVNDSTCALYLAIGALILVDIVLYIIRSS
jgi:hypothetical protein